MMLLWWIPDCLPERSDHLCKPLQGLQQLQLLCSTAAAGVRCRLPDHSGSSGQLHATRMQLFVSHTLRPVSGPSTLPCFADLTMSDNSSKSSMFAAAEAPTAPLFATSTSSVAALMLTARTGCGLQRQAQWESAWRGRGSAERPLRCRLTLNATAEREDTADCLSTRDLLSCSISAALSAEGDLACWAISRYANPIFSRYQKPMRCSFAACSQQLGLKAFSIWPACRRETQPTKTADRQGVLHINILAFSSRCAATDCPQ